MRRDLINPLLKAAVRRGKAEIEEKFAANDARFFRLILKRFDHAMELGRVKKRLHENIRNTQRESEVLNHVASIQCSFLTKELRVLIYRDVMTAARKLESIIDTPRLEQKVARQSRHVLLRMKFQHRKRIDELDREIIRTLDKRSRLLIKLRSSDASMDQDLHAEKTRERIRALQASSEIHQWIWQVLSHLLGRQTTFVATPIKIRQAAPLRASVKIKVAKHQGKELMR